MNASKPVLLVTGFDAFGGEELNPSWEVCAALDGSELGGARVAALRLPCAFGVALDALDAGLAQHAPALVLCLGQAAGRADFSVERVAINVDDARLPDNLGRAPACRPRCRRPPAPTSATTSSTA